MPKKPPPKHNTGRFIFLSTVLVVVLLLAGYLTDQEWHWLSGGGPTYETPAVSPDYLPPDTAAVFHVNMREVQASSYVNREFRTLLQLVNLNLPEAEMKQSLGVDVNRDVDWVRLAVPVNGVDLLVILSGRFDPAKFKPTKDGPLRQVNKPGDRYALYELAASELKMTFTVAPAGDLLLLSGKAERVTDALAQAGGPAPALEDEMLAGLLKKVDRKSVWWAASLKKWRPAPPNVTVVKQLVKIILDNSEGGYGAIACGDDIDGTAYFLTGDERRAEEVENALQGLRGLVNLFGGRLEDWQKPLAKLIGGGEVKRDGDTVVLRCRLPQRPK
jgi:hypothetical protein